MPEDIETLKARIAELEARLEIDHAYRLDGDGDEMVRVEILLEDRARFPDGITCRDATIKLQDEALARKDATIAELQARVASHETGDAYTKTPNAITWNAHLEALRQRDDTVRVSAKAEFEATIASLEQKLEEMKEALAMLIYEITHLSPREEWEGGEVYRPIIRCKRVDEAREVLGVMPPSESADGSVSAEGPLHPGDGNARFCTCQVAQDFERCGAGLLIHEDDDGKVGGLCITGISGGARYVAGTFEDGGFPESLDLVRLDDELGVRMRYQAMPDEEKGPVEVIHPGDGETR